MAGQDRRARRGSAPALLQDAAREAFGELGYVATTREIASRAGVSHELIFRHFGSKEKLFFDAVVTPLLDAVGGLHQRWLDDPELTTMEHDRLIRRFTDRFFEFVSSNRSIARAMVHLFLSQSTQGEVERLRSRISDTLTPMVAPVDGYLASEGLRHSSPALQLRLVLLFVGVAAAFLSMTYSSDEKIPDNEEVVDELANVISRGLQRNRSAVPD